jgi:hypothetical protein
MPCCYNNIFKLCDLVTCDAGDLVLPIPIPGDGEYTLELMFLQDVVRKTATLSAGDNATFDKADLNERFTYVGHVENAAGDHLTFDIDGKTYDAVEFTTKRLVAA